MVELAHLDNNAISLAVDGTNADGSKEFMDHTLNEVAPGVLETTFQESIAADGYAVAAQLSQEARQWLAPILLRLKDQLSGKGSAPMMRGGRASFRPGSKKAAGNRNDQGFSPTVINFKEIQELKGIRIGASGWEIRFLTLLGKIEKRHRLVGHAPLKGLVREGDLGRVHQLQAEARSGRRSMRLGPTRTGVLRLQSMSARNAMVASGINAKAADDYAVDTPRLMASDDYEQDPQQRTFGEAYARTGVASGPQQGDPTSQGLSSMEPPRPVLRTGVRANGYGPT